VALASIVLILLCPLTQAQSIKTKTVTLSEISWIDSQYFEKQRQLIDELGRELFGTRLRGNKSDIQLLQRILDGNHITIFEAEKHKAFGIVLGDIYVKERGWIWQEYRDDEGRSRGVCLPKTQQCVFPLSMFTRRLGVSTEFDVNRIYQRGLDLMASEEPDLPYSVPKEIPKETKELRGPRTIVVPFQ
jgi:hypothetical protein